MSEGSRTYPLGVRRERALLARPGVAAVHVPDILGVQRWGNSPWNWKQQQKTWVLGTSSATHSSYLTEPQSAHL